MSFGIFYSSLFSVHVSACSFSNEHNFGYIEYSREEILITLRSLSQWNGPRKKKCGKLTFRVYVRISQDYVSSP